MRAAATPVPWALPGVPAPSMTDAPALDAADDAALVEAVGGRVVVVDGEDHNVKLTVPGDLPRVEALLVEHPPVPS